MDTTALGLIEDNEGAKSLDREREEGEGSGDIEERSSSMPPPQTPEDQRRSRVQAGVCIQRQQNIRRHSHDPASDVYPTRRNAIRGGRAGHRAMSLDEASHHRTAARSREDEAAGEATTSDVAEGGASGVSGATASTTAGVGQQIIKEEDPIVEKVKMKLYEDDHFILAEVVDRMPAGLHDAILHDELEEQCVATLTNRVGELRRGRLATGDADSAPGTIHWFEGNYCSFISNRCVCVCVCKKRIQGIIIVACSVSINLFLGV